MCLLQTTDLPKLVQIEDIRRTCQAIEDGCFPAPLFPSLAKEGEQNYSNYPLGSTGQSSVEGLFFQIRAVPFPVDLRLVLAHPSSKQAFLLSPSCFSITVQMRGECFFAYQAVFALLPVHFCSSHDPPLSFAPRLGQTGKRGTGSCVLPPGPLALLHTRSHCSVTSGLGSLKSGTGGQRKALC